MELKDLNKVKEVVGEAEVNELLAGGWTLIGTRVDKDGDSTWFVYLVGRHVPAPIHGI